MIDHVVVDIEIQNAVETLPDGWKSTNLMGLGCACVWEMATERMRIFGPEDVDALRARLLIAQRVTGFGSWGFDLPVIWSMPNRQPVVELADKSDDLLLRIWDALYRSGVGERKGWTLDATCFGTLGVGKIGDGVHAPALYQAGQIWKLAEYNADDVSLTRDLCLFMDKFGYAINGTSGRRVAVPDWESSRARLTK